MKNGKKRNQRRKSGRLFGAPATIATLLPPSLRETAGGNISTVGKTTEMEHVDIPAWDNMAAGDDVTLNWAGTLPDGRDGQTYTLTHIVTPGETGQTLSLSVDIVQHLLPYAGGGQLHLSYSVNGVLSEVADISMDGNASTLVAPSVDEAVGTSLSAGLQTVTLRVPAWPGMAERDMLMYFWLGNPDGNGDILSDGLHVPASMVGQAITFSLDPAQALVPFDDSVVEAWYQITPADGGDVLTSNYGTWQVGDVAGLPAPAIDEAIGGQIDPTVTGESAHTRIVYPGMTDGDVLTLYWQGTKEGGTQDTEAVVGTHLVTLPEVTAGAVVMAVETDTWLTPYEGGQVAVRYTLEHGGTVQTSDTVTFSVQQTDVLLPAPSVSEADGDILDPDTPQATVVVDAYPDMAQGDQVTLTWLGDATGEYSDWVPVSSATVNESLQFTVPGAQIAGNTTVSVSYVVQRAAGDQAQSATLTLTTVLPQPLPAPVIDEAVDGWVILEQVADGATARVPAGAALIAGDEVTLVVTAGAAEHRYPHTVTGSQAGQAITFPLAYVILAAADGDTLTLYYTVTRFEGGEEVNSPLAIYEAGRSLKVMGARSQLINSGGGSCPHIRHLAALDLSTSQPQEAEWRYEGEANVVKGARFADLKPEKVLHVSAGDSHLILNTSNINGNTKAMVACRDNGSMVAWGDAAAGGSIPDDIAELADVICTASTSTAFTALRSTGQVVTWGDITAPEEITELSDIIRVSANDQSFAALRSNGQVVAWGDKDSGGSVPEPIAELKDIVSVTGCSLYGYAALRLSGQIVVWGGISLPAEIAELDDIVSVKAGLSAYAALRSTGQVVAWGEPVNGGSVPTDIAGLTDLTEIISGDFAFTARRQNGAVVAWGMEEWGGTIPQEISQLTDIESVTANFTAFTALRSNGKVVAWGRPDSGGNVPASISSLQDIVQVVGTSIYWDTRGAFVALRANGTVVAWGQSTGGSISDDINAQLTRVRAIYVNGNDVFAALTSDGRVVTWGNVDTGADSSQVQPLLSGEISYGASLSRSKHRS